MFDGNITINIGNVSSKDKDRRHRSAIVAASYQAGEVLFSTKKKREVDAREAGDGDVMFTKILAPDGAPDWVFERSKLWNNVERDAIRADSRLAKKIMVAFTRDIPEPLRIKLLEEFVQPFIKMGCVVDLAIHNDPEDHNPHAHILLTTSQLKPDGFMGKGGKIKDLDEKRFVNDTRKAWADITNLYLENIGSSLRVDHRSYKTRGIAKVPTQHRGPQYNEKEHAEPIAHRERGLGSDAEPNEQAEQQIEKTPSRTEDVMSKPTLEELKKYPHLIHREEWPPAREAAQVMTAEERDEHQRYWHEQDEQEIEIIEKQMRMEVEQDYIDAGREHAQQQKQEKPEGEYDFAIRKAKLERGWISEPQREFVEDMDMDRQVRKRSQNEYNALYQRAVDMNPTREEVELRDMAKTMTPERKQEIHNLIIGKRIERLQAADNQARRAELEKHLKDFEKRKLQEFAEADYEVDKDRYPVPGPNGELTAPSELEQGMQAMLAEYERDENIVELDHDANEWQRQGRARDEMINEFEKEQERERER
jgi:hypothetical protein